MDKISLLFLLLHASFVVCIGQEEISFDSLYRFLLDVGETKEQSYVIVHEYSQCPYSETNSEIISRYLNGYELRKTTTNQWNWQPILADPHSNHFKFIFGQYIKDATLDYPETIYNSYILWDTPHKEWIHVFTRYMYHQYNIISALPLLNNYYSMSVGNNGYCHEYEKRGYPKIWKYGQEEDEATYHYYMMAAVVYNIDEGIISSNILQKNLKNYSSPYSKAYEDYINSLTVTAISKKVPIELSEEEKLLILELLNEGIKAGDYYCTTILAYAYLTGTIVEQDIEHGIRMCEQAELPICYDLIKYFISIKQKHYRNPLDL